jgi:hypothetical protein
MPVWEAVGRGLQGILLVQQGKPEGLAPLRSALDDFAKSGFSARRGNLLPKIDEWSRRQGHGSLSCKPLKASRDFGGCMTGAARQINFYLGPMVGLAQALRPGCRYAQDSTSVVSTRSIKENQASDLFISTLSRFWL